MKLKEFNFGFADAAREFKAYRELFKVGFHDPNSYLEKLTEGHKFLVVGRKGVGKTAILSKIQYDTQQTENMLSLSIKLNDLEYNTFKKTKIDKNVQGVHKYKNTWDFLLLVSLVKFLFKNTYIEEEGFINCVEYLESIGIAIDKLEIKKDVNVLSRIKVGGGVPGFSADFEAAFDEKANDYTITINTINDYIKEVLSDLFLKGHEFFILLDGLDDVLRYKNDNLDITKSLLRSINDLNLEFLDYDFKVKIILSIREDMLNMLHDPDMNKIKRDGAINVDWKSKNDELKKLIAKRMTFSGMEPTDSRKYLESMFPSMIRKKTSWEYILDRTLYKPRDLLQFFITCKDIYPDNDYLTVSEIKKCLKEYSSSYFMGEMKDELSGFIEDEYIYILPKVFRVIGSQNFNKHRFKSLINEYSTKKGISDDDLKLLLSLLYNAGYIGQKILDPQHRYYSVNFKHRNPNSEIDYNNDLIIHLGLQDGLGVAH